MSGALSGQSRGRHRAARQAGTHPLDGRRVHRLRRPHAAEGRRPHGRSGRRDPADLHHRRPPHRRRGPGRGAELPVSGGGQSGVALAAQARPPPRGDGRSHARARRGARDAGAPHRSQADAGAPRRHRRRHGRVLAHGVLAARVRGDEPDRDRGASPRSARDGGVTAPGGRANRSGSTCAPSSSPRISGRRPRSASRRRVSAAREIESVLARAARDGHLHAGLGGHAHEDAHRPRPAAR